MNDPFPDELAPLKVKCTQSDCENGLHCYRATARMFRENTAGKCRSCGIGLVDWDRVRGCDLADASFIFECMRTEFIRHHFWHIEIDDKALAHARKKGMAAIIDNVPKRLMQSIGKAHPFRDGTQTPFEGRVVYYAQHATATCCRKCVAEWHGIPQGRPLEEEEIQYLSQLATLYLRDRLVGIPENGLTGHRKKRRGFGPLLEGILDADHD